HRGARRGRRTFSAAGARRLPCQRRRRRALRVASRVRLDDARDRSERPQRAERDRRRSPQRRDCVADRGAAEVAGQRAGGGGGSADELQEGWWGSWEGGWGRWVEAVRQRGWQSRRFWRWFRHVCR